MESEHSQFSIFSVGRGSKVYICPSTQLSRCVIYGQVNK